MMHSHKLNSDYLELSLKRDIEAKNIQHLLHFTDIYNLPSILSNGILSVDQLSKSSFSYSNNDHARYDGYPNAISLSASFPNYSMLSKYRLYELPLKDMAIIFLKPNILWELDNAFFYTNAANNLFNNTPLQDLQTFEAWQSLFSSNIRGVERAHLNIPEYYTTDPQAEIMCFNIIPQQYITKILFSSQVSYQKVSKHLPHLTNIYFYETAQHYFGPRSDYPFWRRV